MSELNNVYADLCGYLPVCLGSEPDCDIVGFTCTSGFNVLPSGCP